MTIDPQKVQELQDLRARVQELERELRRVETERDILKKAAAYFAQSIV